MKIAVVCLFLGEEFKKATKYSRINKIEYANKHGYDYIEDDSVHDKSRPPAWSKILLILKYLDKYDYLFYVDADTYIMNMDRKLEDFINIMEPHHSIFLARDYKMLNTGVMIVKNTDFSKDLLKQVYSREDCINEGNWEQDAFIKIYDASEEVRNGIKVIYHLDFNSYWFNYEPGHFILHFCGNRGRLKFLLDRHCPMRMEDDTDERYNERMNWLKEGMALEVKKILESQKH